MPRPASHGAAVAPGHEAGLRAVPFVERIAPAHDPFEREAERVADVIVRAGASGARGWASAAGDPPLQPGATTGVAGDQPAIRRAPRAERLPEAAGAREEAVAPAAPLIVDDEAEATAAQMRKRDLLATLRSEACAAVDGALAGTGRDSDGCPWIDHWFGYYEGRSAAHVERSLRRYAPEVRAAAAASDYVPAVTARIRRSAATFAATGEVAGVPDEAMSAPAVLGMVGGMFFKARPGGARGGRLDSIRAQLGSGDALPGVVRSRMEPAFGASFAGVRLHADATAAQLSDRLNARAFTIGRHVAFGRGEFQPGTPGGDALIAHELAHVVQQGGAAVAGRALADGTDDRASERDADGAATRAVTALWSPGLAPARGAGLQARPALRSGLRLQRCGSSQKGMKTDAGGKQGKLSVREQRTSAIAEAGASLREVNTWATGQVKHQGVPEITGVVGLPAEHAKNVRVAIERLAQAKALFGGAQLEKLPPKLDEIKNHAREANKYSGSPAAEHVLTAKHELIQAVNAAEEAAAIVGTLGKMFDIDKIATDVDAIVTALNGVQAGTHAIGDVIDAVDKKVKAVKKALQELRERFAATPAAIERIVFVLQSFLALNAPEMAEAPGADDVTRFLSVAGGNLGTDFSQVFGDGKETTGFDVFVTYAAVLAKQLKVRRQMEAAGVTPASPIPSQQNAEDLFTALKTKPNSAVTKAYMDYAQAYFFHRVIDKFQDLQVTSVAEFYTRKLSIMGMRPLVCTGYALLGSHLLRLAGATLQTFMVRIKATDAHIRANNIDSGHAVARMTRNGKTFFVSNDAIADTEDDAIGDHAVAWRTPGAPNFDGFDKNINTAADKSNARLDARRRALRNAPAPTGAGGKRP